MLTAQPDLVVVWITLVGRTGSQLPGAAHLEAVAQLHSKTRQHQPVERALAIKATRFKPIRVKPVTQAKSLTMCLSVPIKHRQFEDILVTRTARSIAIYASGTRSPKAIP